MPANSIDDRKTCDEPAVARTQPQPPGVSTGADVRIRGRSRRVDAIVAHADCCELHLTNAESARRQILLWPFDRPSAPAVRRLRVVRLALWLRAVSTLVSSELAPWTPRATAGAVDIVTYQLAPAIAVGRGATRVLLADEVGLGKTIQAAWIVADAVARDPGLRVLIAVPAAVKRQWVDELRTRFSVDAAGVDATWLRARIADLPADISPWTAPGVYVVSLDFLKRPDLAASAAGLSWDLLIVDEAHTATAPTDRHAALSSIAARARRVVSITATPYSGDLAGFRSMAALGSIGDRAPMIMFRRSREDVGDPRVRRHRFATITLTRAETRLQRMLERYSRDVWNQALADSPGARLAVTILRKRALSSSAAVAHSLRRRLELLAARAPVPQQLALFDENDEIDDEPSAAALATPGFEDAALEQRWLRALIAAADLACSHDSKLHFLLRLLRRLPRESAVIFTEYRDTLRQLAAVLPPTLELHGGLTASERALVQTQFNRDGGLLLATDAASEGLNLHGRCRFVVNYELPWNPARLEQRIGRVDRIGQSRTVHAVTLTARDTAEDLVIKNLARRLTRIVATLGRGDRLGAFLDDARTASVVIGGALFDEPLPEQETDPVITNADADPITASTAAAQLKAAATGQGGWPARASDVLVAQTRSSRHLPSGFAVVLSCEAQTEGGSLVARTVRCLLLGAGIGKPMNSQQARAMADDAVRAFPDPRTVDPSIATWFAAACLAHEASIGSAIAREGLLRVRRPAIGVVQPGLFDRRRFLESAQDQQEDAVEAMEHERRVATLERSRRLYLSCQPRAVLIAWR